MICQGQVQAATLCRVFLEAGGKSAFRALFPAISADRLCLSEGGRETRKWLSQGETVRLRWIELFRVGLFTRILNRGPILIVVVLVIRWQADRMKMICGGAIVVRRNWGWGTPAGDKIGAWMLPRTSNVFQP